MKVGGRIKLGTLGRGLMTQLTTCWSVCALEMEKESGPANLWVGTTHTFKLGCHLFSYEPCNADTFQTLQLKSTILFTELLLPYTDMNTDWMISRKHDCVWYYCKIFNSSIVCVGTSFLFAPAILIFWVYSPANDQLNIDSVTLKYLVTNYRCNE